MAASVEDLSILAVLLSSFIKDLSNLFNVCQQFK